MIEIPSFLAPLLDSLMKKGASPVLVGGFVRDVLLGHTPKDIDIEVYNIADFDTMAQLLKPFGALNFVGKSFGILKLSYCEHEIDFSLPRLEKKIASGHKGFEVLLDPKLSFKEAARRRDFTINAMGYDVNSVTFLDPYNGYEHLKNKILTYVNKDTFVEDPLRVLRAVQFCARFELTCSDELISLARSLCEMGAIKELPKERIFEEISKLLLKSKKPSHGLALFETLNLTKQFPEILNKNNRFTSIDTMANHKTHNHKRDMILMLGLLIFHFDTIEDVNSFLDKLTNETELIKELQTLYIYRYSLADMKQKPLTNYEISLLSTKVTIQNLLLIYEAQGIDIGEIKERSTQLGVLTCKPKALLQGRDLIALGLTPSKQFSEILEIAYDAQLQELFKSSKEAKGWLQNYLKTIC
jgi:tRNA nucleotidyltransferase (CCA-adding enzyme)